MKLCLKKKGRNIDILNCKLVYIDQKLNRFRIILSKATKLFKTRRNWSEFEKKMDQNELEWPKTTDLKVIQLVEFNKIKSNTN